jgi:RHS repeat-associated protein
LIATVNPLGFRTSSGYDAAARQISVTDALGNVTSTVYDSDSRVVGSTNANGLTTTQVYDAISQRIAVEDANANRTTFAFDAAGRRVGMSDALGNLTTWGYDAASRQTLRIDGRGLATTYVYDDASRQTGIQYQNGQRATMVYDAYSQRTVLADWTGSYSSTYDPEGRVTSVVNPAGIAITYAYNAISLRVTMNQPTGLFTYAYDPASRISTLINPEGQATSFAYDANSRVTANSLANGVNASWSYDNAGQILLLANVNSSGTTLSSFNYTYNPVGNRTQVAEVDGSMVTWSYDPTYQLTNEQRSGANAYNITYGYDPVGNRSVLVNNGSPTTYTYNAANELATSQTSAGVTTYKFDGCGNQLIMQAPSIQLTTYLWDGENRLTQVALPSGIVDTFVYNGDGQRVQVRDSSGTTNQTWDWENVLLESDAEGAAQTVYTGQPDGFGGPISERSATATSFLAFDSLGSTRQLIDSAQAVTGTYAYDSMGNPIAEGAGNNPYMYIGEHGYYFESDPGTYYLRTRHYDPASGRFLSRTAPASAGMLALGMMPAAVGPRLLDDYVYAANNAANSLDLSYLTTMRVAGSTIALHARLRSLAAAGSASAARTLSQLALHATASVVSAASPCPCPVGIVDCTKALAKLARIVYRVQIDLARNIEYLKKHGTLDKGHIKEKRQMMEELSEQIALVEKHCAKPAKEALQKAKQLLDELRNLMDRFLRALQNSQWVTALILMAEILAILALILVILLAWLAPGIPPCPP